MCFLSIGDKLATGCGAGNPGCNAVNSYGCIEDPAGTFKCVCKEDFTGPTCDIERREYIIHPMYKSHREA